MRLIIGGKCQGKLLYTEKTYGVHQKDITFSFDAPEKTKCFIEFQNAVKNEIQRGNDPSQLTELLLQHNPDIIILCDEVGCGVVPIDREERYWRETVGRLCCYLAERAESVERIFCGIPMKLK